MGTDLGDERTPVRALRPVDRMSAFVLGRMLASTDTLARRKAMTRIDPMIRASVARRVDAALDDAVRVASDLDETHRRRLALLDVLDRSPPLAQARDAARVTSLCEESAADVPADAPRWTRSLASLLVVVLVAASVGAYFALREAPYAALDPSGRQRADAYVRGGRPVTNPHVRRALAELLPGLSAAATAEALQGRPAATEFARIRRALQARPLADALGPDADAALRRLVGIFVDQHDGRADLTAVRQAVRRFDDALSAHGLAYRVQAMDLGTTTLGLLGFEIRDVTRARIGARTVQVLRADRLDALNVESSIFGYVDADADAIVVPVDRAEVLAATVYAPLLERPPFPSLISPRVSVHRLAWLAPTIASAGVLVSREVGPARCGRSVDAMVALLVERRRLVIEWSDLLVSRGGVEVTQPAGYRLDLERWRRFEGVNPRFSAFERVQRALGEHAASAAIACVRDRIVDAAMPGVAQRFVDLRREAPIPLHDSLLPFGSHDLVQGTGHGSIDGTTLATRSALASIAGQPRLAGLTLTRLLRCWTDGGRCNRDTENAGRVVFGEIGRELAIPDVAEPQFLGVADVARIYRELARRDDVAIAAAARSAFVRLFGDAPVSLR